MTDKQDEILASLATGYQRIADRQEVIEDVFRDSVIVPGNKVNNFLMVTVILSIGLCMTFCFVWYYGG